MIRIIVKITISVLLLISSFFVKAQEFQGKAIYQTKIKMSDDFKKRIDSSKMAEDRKTFMMKMIKKRMERVYELDFNKSASIYKEQKSLEAPSDNFRFSNASNDVLYKDLKTRLFVNKKETFGKIFLIKDSITDYKWVLDKETKMIGNYLCLKATTEIVLNNDSSKFKRFYRNTTKDTTNIKKSKKTKIIAWYTPEIPIANGPAKYGGLPGLILQLDAGNMQILCIKTVLNPKEKAVIKVPTKGKEISQNDYDKVMEKKMKEMREMYKNRRKKGAGSQHKHRH